MSDVRLVVGRCPEHRIMYVSIDRDDDGIGDRVTPTKCCGQWSPIMGWRLSKSDWTELSKLAAKAAEDTAR